MQLQNNKQQPMNNLIKKGFTLIELLVVIAIIGILTAIVTTNLVAARARARDVRRKGDLNSLSLSLRQYYNDHQKFPSVGSGGDAGKIMGCGVGITACQWGSAFNSSSGVIYMGKLPLDPASTVATPITYYYTQTTGENFAIIAKLENLSDGDITDSQTKCASIYSAFTPQEITKDYVVCAE